MKRLTNLAVNTLSKSNMIYVLNHFELPKNTRNSIIKRLHNQVKTPRNAQKLINYGVKNKKLNVLAKKTNFRNIPNITQFEKNLIRMRNLHSYAKLFVSRNEYNVLPQYVKSFNYDKNYSHPGSFQTSTPYIEKAVKNRVPQNFFNKVFLRENIPNKNMINIYRAQQRNRENIKKNFRTRILPKGPTNVNAPVKKSFFSKLKNKLEKQKNEYMELRRIQNALKAKK